jgi:phage gpG-like protein
VNISIEVLNGEDFEAFMESKAEAIVAAVRTEMNAETVNLLAYIKDEKLSGQVLNQRSGNLKNSGFIEIDQGSGQITGFVGFGRTVPYAAILNYGGTIEVPEVSGKLMVFERGGRTVFTMKHRAFTVNMPARNYLESSLEEREPVIVEGFRDAIAKVTNEE